MIRLALPKGRTLEPALEALRGAGLDLEGFGRRRLRQRLSADIEVLMLKDWDLPLYVEQGIADCGVVGSDVLEELQPDVLTPVRLRDGGCRMSLIARLPDLPAPGRQIRVATKYPRWAERLLEGRPWGTEILPLQGSVELGPLLDLAEVAVDIVQTGGTIREHGLVELEVLAEISPCVIIGRAAYQHLRSELNDLLRRMEQAEVVQ